MDILQKLNFATNTICRQGLKCENVNEFVYEDPISIFYFRYTELSNFLPFLDSSVAIGNYEVIQILTARHFFFFNENIIFLLQIYICRGTLKGLYVPFMVPRSKRE